MKWYHHKFREIRSSEFAKSGGQLASIEMQPEQLAKSGGRLTSIGFTNVQADWYYSATKDYGNGEWLVMLGGDGSVRSKRTGGFYVWPVRSGS